MARPILTAAETRAAEDMRVAAGVSVEALMELAGAAVAEAAWRVAGAQPTLILCGPGNNGGDGYVAARLLAARGVKVRVAASAPPRTDAAKSARADWGGPVEPLGEARTAPVLIDALFGTGLGRPLAPEISGSLVRLAQDAAVSLAVDVPSGVASDDGRLLSPVPDFTLTVALGVLKPAHRLAPAASACGRIVLADIGLQPASRLYEAAPIRLPEPGAQANKYSRGKLVVVAGAMAGAARLAAEAAQRAGAGYVELLGGEGAAPPHALVTRSWDESALADARVTAILAGPGLGRDGVARERLEAVLASGKPLVLDADALTLLSTDAPARLRDLPHRPILTPHAGEFARMFGEIAGSAVDRARAAAKRSNAVVVLKGAASVVAHPDGRAAIAPPAPGWLASAGTGDVLAGITAALLAAGHEPLAAAEGALVAHGRAARLAGPLLIADDLIAQLPRAFA